MKLVSLHKHSVGLALIGIGVCICASLGTSCSPKPGADSAERVPPKVVILVSLDTLRADRTSASGYDRKTTPNLTALAGKSVVFSSACAQATQTLISHKSIFAGKYPLRLLRETVDVEAATLAKHRKPDDFLVSAFRRAGAPSLVAGLRKHGYQTAGFTDGGWMLSNMGFADGFADFNDLGGHFAKILPRVYNWLDRHARDRMFLFVHTYDIHCPYPCREPYNSRFCSNHAKHISLEGLCGKPHLMSMKLSADDLQGISDHYDGGILSADAYLGEFLDKLRQMGLYDEALVIVTSDHGESLGEHDQIGHGGLYLEQLLVPLIIKLPASWNVKPQRIAGPVQLVDVLPTIYDVCGLNDPADIDGVSLLPLIDGAPNTKKYAVVQTTFREGRRRVTDPGKRAIWQPARWLLIHSATDDSTEFFDLSRDQKGFTDVYQPDHPHAAALLAELRLYDRIGSASTTRDLEPVNMTEEQLQQLKTLGYIDD